MVFKHPNELFCFILLRINLDFGAILLDFLCPRLAALCSQGRGDVPSSRVSQTSETERLVWGCHLLRWRVGAGVSADPAPGPVLMGLLGREGKGEKLAAALPGLHSLL